MASLYVCERVTLYIREKEQTDGRLVWLRDDK